MDKAIDIDKLYDIAIVRGTNKRIKRIGGTYNYSKKLITINSHVLINSRGGEISYKLFDNVIRHELAHHIDFIKRGYSNHDGHFKDICLNIGNMIDINAGTPYSSDIFEDTEDDINYYKQIIT